MYGAYIISTLFCTKSYR